MRILLTQISSVSTVLQIHHVTRPNSAKQSTSTSLHASLEQEILRVRISIGDYKCEDKYVVDHANTKDEGDFDIEIERMKEAFDFLSI